MGIPGLRIIRKLELLLPVGIACILVGGMIQPDLLLRLLPTPLVDKFRAANPEAYRILSEGIDGKMLSSVRTGLGVAATGVMSIIPLNELRRRKKGKLIDPEDLNIGGDL